MYPDSAQGTCAGKRNEMDADRFPQRIPNPDNGHGGLHLAFGVVCARGVPSARFARQHYPPCHQAEDSALSSTLSSSWGK